MTRLPVSASISPFAARLLAGRRRVGATLGHGYVLFGDRVLAITPLGALRMPNGIEADVSLRPGEHVLVGGGELRTADATIRVGTLWDPRPRLQVGLSISPSNGLHPDLLIGRGPGLTPLGDDILVGYLAGAALRGDGARGTIARAERAVGRTTALSLTLLRLAARGQLPEAAHLLVENGDPSALLSFGATSGKGIAVGLGLACATTSTSHVRMLPLHLPELSTTFELSISGRFEETPQCKDRPH